MTAAERETARQRIAAYAPAVVDMSHGFEGWPTGGLIKDMREGLENLTRCLLDGEPCDVIARVLAAEALVLAERVAARVPS